MQLVCSARLVNTKQINDCCKAETAGIELVIVLILLHIYHVQTGRSLRHLSSVSFLSCLLFCILIMPSVVPSVVVFLLPKEGWLSKLPLWKKDRQADVACLPASFVSPRSHGG